MRLLAPTTLKRTMLKTSLRQIVGPTDIPGVRKVTILIGPANEGIYAGIDEDIAKLNPDRFVFELSPLPINRDPVFHLQPHQTIVAAVRAGNVAVGVQIEYHKELP